MSAQREALIDRIRKLQKFTLAAGCSEHEASAAAQKVSALIAEYDVTSDELRIRTDAKGCITDTFIELNATRSDWMTCALPIARLYHCRVWYTNDRADPLGLGFEQPITVLKYFGFPSDVAACVATSAIIYNSITGEAAALPRRSGKLYLESFRAGMIARICERLREMTQQRQAAQVTGQALIVLKDALVTEEYAKLNLRLGTVRSSTMKDYNSAAFAAGAAAGNRTDLGGKRVPATQRAIIG